MDVTPLSWSTPAGAVMRGSLYHPAGDGLACAAGTDLVVLHHGFASTRTEALGLFMGLARELCARGFTVASFDRVAHGESDGEFDRITIETEVEDAVGAITWLADHPTLRPRSVSLLGMSMGAVVAGVAAARLRTPVASMVFWSPAAVFADELRGGSIQGRPFGDLATTGYVDFLGLRLSAAYVDAAARFDPYAQARGYEGPVLVMHGADDAIVPSSYALAYGDVYGDRAEITVVDGADHGWSSVGAREVLYDRTLAFLVRHTAPVAARPGA